jgi:hypothetical protein
MANKVETTEYRTWSTATSSTPLCVVRARTPCSVCTFLSHRRPTVVWSSREVSARRSADGVDAILASRAHLTTDAAVGTIRIYVSLAAVDSLAIAFKVGRESREQHALARAESGREGTRDERRLVSAGSAPPTSPAKKARGARRVVETSRRDVEMSRTTYSRRTRHCTQKPCRIRPRISTRHSVARTRYHRCRSWHHPNLR